MTETDPYRDEITEDEASELGQRDPNVAGADHGDDGVVDHLDHAGDFVDSDEEHAARADAHTATIEPDATPEAGTDAEPDTSGGAQ